MSIREARSALSKFRREVADALEQREVSKLQAEQLVRQSIELANLADFYAMRTDRGALPKDFGGYSLSKFSKTTAEKKRTGVG